MVVTPPTNFMDAGPLIAIVFVLGFNFVYHLGVAQLSLGIFGGKMQKLWFVRVLAVSAFMMVLTTGFQAWTVTAGKMFDQTIFPTAVLMFGAGFAISMPFLFYKGTPGIKAVHSALFYSALVSPALWMIFGGYL